MTPRYPALVLLRQRPSVWFVNIWADDIYWCMVVQNRDSFVELCQKWNMTVCVLQVSVNRKITLSEHIILILQQREQPRTPLLPAVKKREKCTYSVHTPFTDLFAQIPICFRNEEKKSVWVEKPLVRRAAWRSDVEPSTNIYFQIWHVVDRAS